ncbi:hypothetical protein EST38_g10288 [Candolleomyces aberdarensis]|uniref:Uncharacterized protein n=1 Tax=Candolleomyces aberdarensis TaxID=2316362 RepID=A0A4Q2D9E7_9AGAR|nr:hypothetical protein EST38_g10288 [Candolleomyces aberdarensis]
MSDDRTLEETTFSIPYAGGDDEPRPASLPGAPRDELDFPESHERRFETYRKAWSTCLDRIQSIVKQLLEPHIEAVIQQVEDDSAVPGLPHPELPVISISNPVFGASFLNDVCSRLDTPSTHLYPSDCVNLTSAMRALITGLVQDTDDDIPRVKHKVSERLANYDINYLTAWYKHYVSTQGSRPVLLAVLHNFEEFDPTVMQDVFYICSQQLPELRLSFILSLSTPLPTYLHIVYPRATLACLRIRTVAIPNGLSVLNDILLQTFLSPFFDSDVILGPAALEHISDFFTRHNRTLDSLITLIQLAYMKHFSVGPLTSLLYSTPSTPSPALLEAALTSILATNETAMDGISGADAAKEKIVELIDESRSKIQKRYKTIRIAFNLTRLMQLFFVGEGYKGLGWNLENDLCAIFGGMFLKRKEKSSGLERSLGYLSLILKKLNTDQLRRLSHEIHEFLRLIDAEGDDNLRAAQTEFSDLTQGQASDENHKTVAAEMADWIDDFLRNLLLERLEDIPLWEVWYTGMTPFPSELVNPSIRASLLSGLLRPLEFVSSSSTSSNANTPGAKATEMTTVVSDESLWRLPDTSILFRRYLDSGRLINVYDWFESFQAVLETQREEVKKERARGKGKGRKSGSSASPSKGKGRGGGKASATATPKRSPTKKAQQSPTKIQKGKQRQQPGDDDDVMDEDEEEEEEETEEKWQIEVQARFIRALHELDYLGFIKHTKRRADHVARTVFDINDE